MKRLLFLFLILSFVACNEEPYLKHNLSFTKAADECSGGEAPLKLTSNTNGERYEFKQCLPQEFKGNYTVTRSGDTLFVGFPDTIQTTNALFNLVLDINTFPKYSHIKLGEQLIKVGTGQASL